jgi:uncharacterized coiled-coil protein SlyX
MKKVKDMTPTEKLDYLIKKVEEIDQTINPPTWKSFMHWSFAHFWTILAIGTLAYFVWQIWDLIQAMQANLDALGIKVTDIKEMFLSQVDKLKFWK